MTFHGLASLAVCASFSHFLLASAKAQAAAPTQEIGIVYYVGEGAPLALAKEAESQSGRGTYSGRVSGAHSNFRLRADQAQVFEVCGVDPSRFKLFRFKSEKSSRSVTIAKTNLWIGGSKTVLSESEIPVTIKAADGNCFTLTTKQQLADGEYGFSPAESTDAFMFAIGNISAVK